MKLKGLARGTVYGVVLVVIIYVGVVGLVRISVTTTTAVVVRHAEKAADGGSDPPLSEHGVLRASALAHVLEDADVAAAYCCTTCARTLQTVRPLSVPITRIGDGAYDELVSDVFSNHAGQTVVIAGHSNTVPNIIDALGSRVAAAVGENEYDKLFVVIVHDVRPLRVLGLRHRKVDTLKLKYGAPS